MDKEKRKKRVVVIGAGPGGLASAMILAHRGFDVVIYEKRGCVGGRTSPVLAGNFTFELGPTFVMLKQVFDEVFSLSGRKIEDYLDLRRLDILYRLRFGDGRDFRVYFDKNNLKKEIARLFPGDEKNYDRYMARQKIKFEKMYPCLKVPYQKWYHYLSPNLLKALPYMDNFSSIYGVLSRYFEHEDMRISMTFQSKYLGMSPWDCPGPFTILSYIEHALGIYHPMGGVHKITEAMARVVNEEGGVIKLNSSVSRIIMKNGAAVGVELSDGTKDFADYVIMNADFASGIKKLVPEKNRPAWKDAKIEKSPLSCSTFMLYLGLDKLYPIEHHNIFFAGDYRENIREIFEKQKLPEDPSFYLQNASVTDPSLAPEGKSTVYVLVPVPNLGAPILWDDDLKKRYRDLVIKKIEERTEMKDLSAHIEEERIVTPRDWEEKVDVYKGAVFNLAHTLGQMLYLRPHNHFENIKGMYLAGGGTHPGSGLPTILESGRITADLISKDGL